MKHLKFIPDLPIDQLKPSEYNPRIWDQKTIRDLTKSIKEHGFVVPILVNEDKSRYGVVIGGHFRLKVAKDLGYKTVPVNFVDIPDIDQEKKLNLTLNRVSGDWDYELLKNFDIELLLESGFDDTDLTHIFDDMLGVEDDDFDAEEEAAKIWEPKTKLGDLILLGQHRLICGDSTNPEVVSKLIGTDKADVLDFDPPFNIHLSYDKGVATKGKYGGKTQDNLTDQQYRKFLEQVLQNGLQHIRENAHIFCWCDESYVWLVQSLYRKLGIVSKRVCLWIKNSANPTPIIAFNKAYEPCVYGVIGKPYLSPSVRNLSEVLNKEAGSGNRLPDDIMDLFNIWLVKRVNGQDYEHPTQKPPTLYEKVMRRCSRPGDTILDLFGGSGSQLIAAEQLKRKMFLAEIDPVFCDVIVKRYQQLTGMEAKYVNQ
ncbi:MAG: DNA modification methylase [bacterium]